MVFAATGLTWREGQELCENLGGHLAESKSEEQNTFLVSLAKLEGILKTGESLFAAIARGEGTIGGLINDPEFSDDARQLGKLLKRQPWTVFGHPGNKRPTFGKTPLPPEM